MLNETFEGKKGKKMLEQLNIDQIIERYLDLYIEIEFGDHYIDNEMYQNEMKRKIAIQKAENIIFYSIYEKNSQ